MMNKKKSSSVGIIKYTLFVPLFLTLLFVYNLQAQDVNKEPKKSDEIVVVNPIDDIKQLEESRGEVFTLVEDMPQFPGGDKELMNYLSQNIKYPVDAAEKKIEGTVVLRFVVSKTGEVTDVSILRSVAPSLDEEAIRAVSAMPKWIPGKQGGKEVNVYYTLPIWFKLQADDITPKKDEAKTSGQLPANATYEVNGKIVSVEVARSIPIDDIEAINVIKDDGLHPNGLIQITLKKDRLSF